MTIRDSMKSINAGKCVNLESARVARMYDCVQRLSASNGRDIDALHRLRAYVEADLLGRDRPVDLPRIYGVLRGTAMLPILAEVVDDVSQQFVIAGKRVAAVVLILAARLHCDAEDLKAGDGRIVSNLGPLRALEHALRQRLGCQSVSFDPRFYPPPLLGLVDARQIRSHAAALMAAQPPEAPVVIRPIVSQRQPEWRIVSLLGAVVHANTQWIDTRAPIPIGPGELAKADLCLEEVHSRPGAREVHVECRAHGVHYLRGGVRFAEDVRRGLRTGVQHLGADAYVRFRMGSSSV